MAGKLVGLTEHDSVSRETVRRRLAENGLKPWRKDMWCIPQVDGEYVARMEDVLDLYAEEPNPKCPVVLFDEEPDSPASIGEGAPSRIPGRAWLQLGNLGYDWAGCERNGTTNLFHLSSTLHRPWRQGQGH